MKVVTIGHMDYKSRIELLPKSWIQEHLIVSPRFHIDKTGGYHFVALKLTAQEMMNLPKNKVQEHILDAATFAQNKLGADLIQLGGLTTSVTCGGKWLADQKEYSGFVNHGDSYTAAVTCQAALMTLSKTNKNPSDLVLAIVGAYGIIGEAVSKILVPKFSHSILIGRKENKLKELKEKVEGSYKTATELKTTDADIIITATSHPTALLKSNHLKQNAIVVDVSQPPNLTEALCKKRPDILRIDGGYVDFSTEIIIPGIPIGKLFACIAEVIMQAKENEQDHHVGSIELKHLCKTEKWAKKYGYELKELTNFGKTISHNKFSKLI